MKNLPVFKLEDYLSTREFRAPYMLCASDAETHSMTELLNMADDESANLWNKLTLNYTEPYGLPILLKEIAGLYGDAINLENILSFAGAEEAIYCACHALLSEIDHAIVITPCYQSLESIPSSLCDVTKIQLRHEDGWRLDLDKVKEAIKPNTKLLLINYPHNPTGALLTKEEQAALINLARAHNIWIFSDEVYRMLELSEQDRLPMMVDQYEKGLSLGVMSKAFGLAGLRVGWIAFQSKDILQKMSGLKHYLSICNSAPSEVLSLIALRNKDKILDRNLGIMKNNILLLDLFFEDYAHMVEWVRPKGGCIGFPKLKAPISAYDFSEDLLNAKGVVTLPHTVYDFEENHFRVGFGRKNMPAALQLMRDFIDSRKEWRRAS